MAATLFVSCVPGTVVERFGMRGVYIGAKRVPPPDGWQWDEAMVVGISPDELARYPREYQGALDRGELRERSESDYHDYVEAEAKATTDAKSKADAELAKLEADAAKKSKADKNKNALVTE